MSCSGNNRWQREQIARENRAFLKTVVYWQPKECSFSLNDGVGDLPVGLRGTLFRIGPALFQRDNYWLCHLIDGDGMVAKWEFDGNQVHFSNRYVQTSVFRQENTANRFLFNRIAGFATGSRYLPVLRLSRIFPKNIANTNILAWNDQLYAFWEGGLPYILSPETLDTIGQQKLPSVSRCSAHPKIEYRSDGQRRLINFAIRPTPLATWLSVLEAPEGEPLKRTRHIRLPGFVYLHDFIITERYCIFFITRFKFALPGILSGRKGLIESITPKPGAFGLFLDRSDKQADVYIPLPDYFAIHHANAWQQGERIVVDSFLQQGFSVAKMDLRAGVSGMESMLPARLHRLLFDLRGREFTVVYKESVASDFPAIHPGYIGRPYRYLYATTSKVIDHYHSMTGLVALDWETQHRKTWFPEPFQFVTEPVFAPDISGNPRENAGWLLSALMDIKRRRIALIVLDASRIDQGPIAELPFPEFVLPGLFHGSFCCK